MLSKPIQLLFQTYIKSPKKININKKNRLKWKILQKAEKHLAH